MKCKYCLAEIEDDVTVCPLCGKELTEEEEVPTEEEIVAVEEEIVVKKKKKAEKAPKTAEEKAKCRKCRKIVLATAGLVLLAAILTCAVLHFTNVINVTKWFVKQDIYYKDSYTAENAKVERKGQKVIATVGNQELTNAELQIHYWNMVQEFIEYYGGYNYVKYVKGLDPAVSLDQQTVKISETEEMTYEQWFLQNALESWRRYATLVQMAEDAKFEMTEAQKQEIAAIPDKINAQAQEEGFTDAEAYIDKYYPGSSVQGFVDFNTIIYKAMFYYDELYENLLPTQAEIEAYYIQNESYFIKGQKAKEDGLYYTIRHIFIPIEGDPGEVLNVITYSDEEWAQCEAKAQKVLDDFLADNGTEQDFAQRAKEVSGDADSASNGGYYEKLTKHSGMVDSFKEWYMNPARKYGDVELVKNTGNEYWGEEVQGYHIMFFVESYAIWESVSENAVLSEKTDAVLKEAEAKWPIEIKYSKIVLGQVETAQTATDPT